MRLAQVLLIAGVILITWRFLAVPGARTQAIRRLGMLFLALFAIVTVLLPDSLTEVAKLVGIGRGTDLVLYALVVAFVSFAATTYRRFREMELRYTRLARRLALDEARRPGTTGSRRVPAREHDTAPDAGPETVPEPDENTKDARDEFR